MTTTCLPLLEVEDLPTTLGVLPYVWVLVLWATNSGTKPLPPRVSTLTGTVAPSRALARNVIITCSVPPAVLASNGPDVARRDCRRRRPVAASAARCRSFIRPPVTVRRSA